jgi:hypothetical protein
MKTTKELLASINEKVKSYEDTVKEHGTKVFHAYMGGSGNAWEGVNIGSIASIYGVGKTKVQNDIAKRFEKLRDDHSKSHKKSVKESTLTRALDILEDLETEDEISEFLETLDEDTYAGVAASLDEGNLDEVNKIEKRQDGLNRTLSDKRYYKESTLEKAISNYRSINEGTWILTSKDGIQKRFKDDNSPEAKAWVSGNQKKEKIMSAKVPKAAAVSLDTIWRKVEDVVGNIYPDGDPIDYLGPWCKKQGIDYSMVDKAAKKHGFKDVYAYWDSMSEDLGQL